MLRQIPHVHTTDLRYPLATVNLFDVAGVSTPVPFFKKQTDAQLGFAAENITHEAATHPLYAAHASKHEFKLLCTEFARSMFCPAAGIRSVVQSRMKETFAVVAL